MAWIEYDNNKLRVNNKEINQDFDKMSSLIGYYPQFDAIFESLIV